MSIYDWERCTHEGIGQPGCPTCDPDHDRVMIRAQRQFRAEGAAATAFLADLWATVRELRVDVRELRAERDALKAQVEAARALCRDQLDHGKVEADDLACRVLDAMDEAGR